MPLARLAAALWALLLGGCAGMKALDFVTGQCAEALDQCYADQCTQVVDATECETECAYQARVCERRQGTEGRPRARLGDEAAALVDLRGPRLRHSSTVVAQVGGRVTAAGGHHTLAPGAFLRLDVTLPPRTRDAEVVLTHQPAGAPCYVTVTAGDGTLLGRYQPPAAGRFKAEVFDFSKYLPKAEPDQPVPVTLTIFNNDAAGSQVPYHLAEVQIFYRAVQPPAP